MTGQQVENEKGNIFFHIMYTETVKAALCKNSLCLTKIFDLLVFKCFECTMENSLFVHTLTVVLAQITQ